MSVFDTLRIGASGLTAQRLRMDVAASNLANAETTRTPEGGAYQKQSVVFVPYQLAGPGSEGVAADAIVNPEQQPRRIYDPAHPDADATGFVSYPDVDVATEMADMMSAARSYQIGSTVVQAAKQTALEALELGRR